jgi:hypothetical protein
LILLLPSPALYPEPYSSAQGGFYFDLPPDYRPWTAQGDRLSFRNPQGSVFEITLIPGPGKPEAPLERTARRLGSGGGLEKFDYRGREAALVRLEFEWNGGGNPGGGAGGETGYTGWGLCVDRGEDLLLALAYGPRENRQDLLHLSCLDSIAPAGADRYYWGPVTGYAWPRGEERETPLYGAGVTAMIGAGDAEAAQALTDREFQILRRFESSPLWQDAWRRFYRMIRRDSWERLKDALFRLERRWNAEALLGRPGTADGDPAPGDGAGGLSDRELASKALAYVQNFRYERDLMGSDFVNLVSALTEGRGDCDSRALLWSLFLAQANIEAGIMVSLDYRHAMGIADIEGPGARFPFEGKGYLVAETTAPVELGLIARETSEIAKWLGVNF